MPRLSFVIPTLNEDAGLGDLLDRLRGDFPHAERIVVDGGSSDGTVAIALRGADCVLLSPPGRARQMNLGAAAATGDYLCFLHADTRPCFDEQALHAALDRDPSWGYCRVSLRSRRRSLRVVAACMNWRSRLTRVATGDQMFVIARSLFAAQGGFAAIPLMEDVELCKRLRRVAAPRMLPLAVSSSARRWERHGVVSTVLRMWLLRLAYWLGIAPERLWRHYYGDAAQPARRAAGS